MPWPPPGVKSPVSRRPQVNKTLLPEPQFREGAKPRRNPAMPNMFV